MVNLKCHLIGLPQPVIRLITTPLLKRTSLTSRHHTPGFPPTSLAFPSKPPLRVVPIPSDLQLWGAPGLRSSPFILTPQGTVHIHATQAPFHTSSSSLSPEQLPGHLHWMSPSLLKCNMSRAGLFSPLTLLLPRLLHIWWTGSSNSIFPVAHTKGVRVTLNSTLS